MTEIYINQQQEKILQYAEKINNGLYMEPCISDFVSSIELIFPAVSLQNANQGQNLTSNPDILSPALRVGLSAVLHLCVILW
jgi:pyoverdine/dityrosine biosynthesis protein Dit1